jgi:hypothetical protein
MRCLEVALLIMESFDGMRDRYDISIVGHSGDSPCILLVEFGKPPPKTGSKRDGLRNALNRTLRFSLLVYQGQIGQFLFCFQIAKELLLKMHMRL